MRTGWGPALRRVQDPRQDLTGLVSFSLPRQEGVPRHCGIVSGQLSVWPLSSRSCVPLLCEKCTTSCHSHAAMGRWRERGGGDAPRRALHSVSRPFLTKTEDARSVAPRIHQRRYSIAASQKDVISALPVTRTGFGRLRTQLSRISLRGHR